MNKVMKNADVLEKCQTKCLNNKYIAARDALRKERLNKVVNGKSNASVIEKTRKSKPVQEFTRCTLQLCKNDLVKFIASFEQAFRKDLNDITKGLKKMKNKDDYEFWSKMKTKLETSLKEVSGYRSWDEKKLYEVALRLSNRRHYQLFNY